MATDPDRPNEGAWSELERGFFASAPPDVPGPAPEPMRFDDLEPIGPPPQPWRDRLSRAWATTAGAPTVQRALRSRAPAVAAARLAARAFRVGRAQAARFAAVALPVGRAQAARLAAVLRSGSRDRRIVAVAAATLIVVTSISAGVVASRGGGRTASGHAPTVYVSAGVGAGVGASSLPMISQAEIASPSLMTEAEPETPPSSGSIAPEPMPPPQHRRKHGKPSTRHSAPTKAAGKPTPRGVARR